MSSASTRPTSRPPLARDSSGAGRVVRVVVALLGAFATTLALSAGSTPGSLSDLLDGNSALSIVAFAAIAVTGWWAIGWLRRGVYAWAVPVGIVFATTDLLGLSLLRDEADLGLLRPSAWGAVHWTGVAYIAILGIAVLLQLAERAGPAREHDATERGRGRFTTALRREGRAGIGPLAIVFVLLVLSRIPFFAVWWPGILRFDTFRSLSYAMGLRQWEAYEPVGHSLLIAAWHGIWQAFGLSDSAALAVAAALQVLTTSAAFAIMLWRIAVWGAPRWLWGAMLAWVGLLPAIGIASITIVKDIPFMSAFVLFLVGIVEVSRSIRRGRTSWGPWIFVFVAGIATMVLRSNGVYVVLLGSLLLFIPFRHQWKRMLAVFVGFVAVFALYSGPLYAALDVRPGPKTEVWSIPLQQIARIAFDHHEELADEDRAFVNDIFTKWDVDEVGNHYIAEFSDPIKLDARATWDERTTGEFLGSWWRLVREYPTSAVTATLANTVGYWAPGAPSYDGIFEVSSNDVRDIHLDIPTDEPTTGVRGFLDRNRLLGEGFQAIPVLGMTLSPGAITWVWIFGLLILWRKRAGLDAAFALPAAVLMATFLAGPVSGGMRYALGFMATVPIVLAVAVAARHRRSESREHGGRGADV